MNPRMDPRHAKCFLVVMDPGWGKSKMERIFYDYGDALQACAEDQRQRPNTKYHLIWGPDEATVNASYADLMRGGTIRTESMEQDLTRYSKEHGPGGDHDEAYHYEAPPTAVGIAWTKIAASVSRGQVGGENDGGDDTTTGDPGEAA